MRMVGRRVPRRDPVRHATTTAAAAASPARLAVVEAATARATAHRPPSGPHGEVHRYRLPLSRQGRCPRCPWLGGEVVLEPGGDRADAASAVRGAAIRSCLSSPLSLL